MKLTHWLAAIGLVVALSLPTLARAVSERAAHWRLPVVEIAD